MNAAAFGDDVRARLESARLLLLEDDAASGADRLYARWYHRETHTTLRWPGDAAYRAAVLDAKPFEPGWRTVSEVQGWAGGVIAMRGGRERLVAPPEMTPADVCDLIPGRGSALLVHPLASAEVAGFWHAWSAGWQRASPRRLHRIYVEVAHPHALELARHVVLAAPARSVWALKMLCGTHESGRRDRAVFYLPIEVAIDTPWVETLLRDIEVLCEDELPPFVRRRARGIGHAIDPGGGRSYGQALCDAVASAADQVEDREAFARRAIAAVEAIAADATDIALPGPPGASMAKQSPIVREHRAQTNDMRGIAVALAREIASEAVWADGQCTFFGATSPESPTDPPRFRSMSGDVYEGSAGVARFLGHASALSGDKDLAATSIGAVRHALSHVDGWGLFTGRMGVGVVALELCELMHDADLAAEATRLIGDAGRAALTDGAPYDFLAGTAGVIAGLAAVQKYDDDGSWRHTALELGHTLLAAAVADGPANRDGRPLSWALGAGIDARLCGLAHGAAGVALAFDALARLAPDDETWSRAARRARAYERAHYARDIGSWADLRRFGDVAPDHAPGFPHMWCHGSIGIGAERLIASARDELARADAAGALAGARAYARKLLEGPVGPGAGDELNTCVCHGLAGLVDLFVDAWCVSGDTSLIALAGEVATMMCADARRPEGWRSGVPGGWPAPGLMLGKAGAGWALLRLSDPDRVPSAWRLGPRDGA